MNKKEIASKLDRTIDEVNQAQKALGHSVNRSVTSPLPEEDAAQLEKYFSLVNQGMDKEEAIAQVCGVQKDAPKSKKKGQKGRGKKAALTKRDISKEKSAIAQTKEENQKIEDSLAVQQGIAKAVRRENLAAAAEIETERRIVATKRGQLLSEVSEFDSEIENVLEEFGLGGKSDENFLPPSLEEEDVLEMLTVDIPTF